jgi:hypothetical protein
VGREHVDVSFGTSFGTLQGYSDPDLKKQDPEKEHLRACKTNFVEALVKMINLPLRHGFAPKRWCTSITVMIEKDPGNPHIE